MLEKLESILEHFASLDHRLAEVGQDYQLAAELSKERSDLEPLVELAKEYKENFTKGRNPRTDRISEGEMLELAKWSWTRSSPGVRSWKLNSNPC